MLKLIRHYQQVLVNFNLVETLLFKKINPECVGEGKITCFKEKWIFKNYWNEKVLLWERG